jgi:hypothetical protein
MGVLLSLAACGRGDPKPQPTPVSAESVPSNEDPPRRFEEPDIRLIRFACEGFDAAVAAGAPEDRLLSHSAAHAIELGGAEVEAATTRWALLPPQGLLEEIARYEREVEADPKQCAGLRAHLERMALVSASH